MAERTSAVDVERGRRVDVERRFLVRPRLTDGGVATAPLALR